MEGIKDQGYEFPSYDHVEGNSNRHIRGKAKVAEKKKLVMVRQDKVDRIVTKGEFMAHANEQNPWFVLNGHVYDGTRFLNRHPGGASSLIMVAGTDATEDFMILHSDTAKRMVVDFHVGRLEIDSGSEKQQRPPIEQTSPEKVLLDLNKWRKLKLSNRKDVSRDSRILSFELDHPEQNSGVPVGNHVLLRLVSAQDAEFVIRPYTPISCPRTKGQLDLLVKVYFPDGGKSGEGQMTTLIEQLKIGQMADVKGPFGVFEYFGHGKLKYKTSERTIDHFYMVSGGSGITPCYQIIQEIAEQATDNTKVTLFYGNRSKQDILCHDELETLSSTNTPSGNIDIKYFLSREIPSDWNYSIGRIDSNVMSDHIPIPSNRNASRNMLLVCGPDGMVRSVRDWANANGWNDDDVVYF